MKKQPLYLIFFKYSYFIPFIACAALISCESFVDIDAPASQLAGTAVYEDANTANAAVTSIYSALQRTTLVNGATNGLSILMGSYADELTSYSNYGLPEEVFFKNNLQPDDQAVFALWSDCYSLIYTSNAVIEGVRNSSSIAQTDKDKLIGEALFVRSYIHFYLMQLFGEIPYVTQTNYTINAKISKTSTAMGYNLLTEDVQHAQELLPTQYTDPLRIRPNQSAATALLARVHLYNQQYGAAENQATQVINNTQLYTMEPSLDNVFLINSRSTLWQLMPAATGLNTLEAQHFIFNSGPPPARAVSNSLVEAFEPNDGRKEFWLGKVTEGTETWYYPFKYKQPVPTGSSQEYAVQLRLEEMYLIRAEARLKQGDEEGAKQDLNTIRNRAGLPDSNATDSNELLTAIVQERRVEFFTEHGHRFFDLKRTGLLDAQLTGIKPGWNTTDSALPLPQKELSLNKNLLPQNAGY